MSEQKHDADFPDPEEWADTADTATGADDSPADDPLAPEAGAHPDELETVEGEFVETDVPYTDPDETVAQDPASRTQPLGPLIPAAPADQAPAEDSVHEFISETIRQKRSSRLAIFPLAIGFIGLGILLLAEGRIEGLVVSPAAATVILIGSLVLTYLFRFFTSGRRERGLFFLAVIAIVWGMLFALTTIDEATFPIEEFWPLTLAGVGVAFFLTFLFERSHQVGLVFPGMILLFASGIAFLVTLEIIEESILEAIEDYWPLVISFVGIILLPSALQDR